jgi:hypothetical protein
MPVRNAKPKQYHVLLVSYPLDRYTWGSIDDRLEIVVKRGCTGAGTGFGQRDINWHFHQRPAAKAALRRGQALRHKGVDLSLDSYDSDGE